MWPQSDTELIEVQRGLALTTPQPWTPQSSSVAVGAAVVVFPRFQTGRGARGDPAWAAAAVLRGRRVVAEATITTTAAAPYEPGLLALREGPSLEAVASALPVAPDVLLVDATGRDHPRRAGLALHLGAVTGLPTVGVTHRPLLADGPWPPDEPGAYTPLRLDGECVGAWCEPGRNTAARGPSRVAHDTRRRHSGGAWSGPRSPYARAASTGSSPRARYAGRKWEAGSQQLTRELGCARSPTQRSKACRRQRAVVRARGRARADRQEVVRRSARRAAGRRAVAPQAAAQRGVAPPAAVRRAVAPQAAAQRGAAPPAAARRGAVRRAVAPPAAAPRRRNDDAE